MKVIIALSALVSTAMAAVTAIPTFTLQAVAPNQPFDGMTLSLNGPLVGLNNTGSPVQFYATGADNYFTWSLHGYPIGIIDTPAVLVGDNAYKFAFLSNPEEVSKQYGPNMMMDGWTFNLGKPSIKIAPAPGKFLGYNFEQRWYAFPGEQEGQWNVMWWDGSCCMTANGFPIKLRLVQSDAKISS
ncbi:hypothetical protein ABW21_db0207039 [Orbilia brochopaga]|nr:hypothetical protein ABW21_db0207039 [Drechslerella brochopaga]